MNKLSDVCGCAREPIHTVGFCAVLSSALRKLRAGKVVYSSKRDVKLKRVRLREKAS